MISKICKRMIVSSLLCASTATLQSVSQNCENTLKSQMTSGGYHPQQNCGVASDLMTWIAIQEKDPAIGLYDVTLFIIDHPNWPSMEKLQARAESLMDATVEPDSVVEWFSSNPPQTSDGFLNYARALKALGQKDKAREVAREGWIQRNFSREEAQEYLSVLGNSLTSQDHEARLERLLWDEEVEQAKRLVSLVGPSAQKMAEARLAFLNSQGQASLNTKHEGVLYESVRALRKSEDLEKAARLIANVPHNSDYQDKWWKERNYIAREYMKQGRMEEAYNIIEKHGLKEGESFADAEFLTGFVALRFLNNPDEALSRFVNLYENVKSPMSKSRAAYWAGRAAEAQSNVQLAKSWYEKGSKHTTCFYGQLSAEKLQKPSHPQLQASPKATPNERKAFEAQDVVQAFKLLTKLGKSAEGYAKTFAINIAKNAQTTAERHLLVDLAARLSPHAAAAIAKKVASIEGVHLKAAYPTIKHPLSIQGLETALVNGLIMQESRFDPYAVSQAGARGLMQLMPATAKKEAQKMKVSHSESKLNDPKHNVHLGSHYIHSLIQSFDGSYILAIASYNAGKDAVNRWLSEIGDPRRGDMDVVDWLEMIPYYETRNYVQRVLENVNVYRAHSESKPKVTLVHDLQR